MGIIKIINFEITVRHIIIFRKSNTMLLVTINTVINTFVYCLLTSQEINASLTNCEGQAPIFFKLI